MKKIYSLSSLLTLLVAISVSVKAQVITVFSDNFDRSAFTTGNSYGTPAAVYTFNTGGTSTIGTSLVSGSNYVANITSGTTAQRALFVAPVTGYGAPFNTQLNLNSGIVTWTFNMQTSVAVTTNAPLAGSVAGGIDLGGNAGANIYTGSPTGYGVVFNSGPTGGVALVKFSAGLNANTSIITQTTTVPPTDYYSVRVTYDPATNNWSLYVRDDGATGFADPSTGVTLQQGSTVSDATYTGITLTNFGALYTFPASTGVMSVDNYTVSVTICHATGTITGNTAPICGVGGTLTLSDPTGYPTGSTWSSSNAGVASVDPSTGIVTSTGPGTATITYNVPFPCTALATTVVSVNSIPTIVPGVTSVCTGASVTLIGFPSSGTWASGTPTVATIDGFGNATGVALGGSIITYTLNNCFTTQLLTVNNSPSPIAGNASICPLAISSLSDPVTGGTWSSSATGIATVDAIGNVTGIATTGGTTNIIYTLPSGCSVSKVLTVNPLPFAFLVGGTSTYCAGSPNTVSIILSGSSSSVNYTLFNGASTIGVPVTGTGLPLNFGIPTVPGTYTVSGTNPTTGCFNTMNLSAIVAVKPVPAAFTVTGGGSYCENGAGVPVGLNGSTPGVSYQLYVDGTMVIGSVITGTGSALSFGNQTVAGNYTVVATITGPLPNCTSNMISSAPVHINPLPDVENVIGGGAYCAGGTGVAIGLDFSATGVSYRLYNGTTPVGLPVPGTGGPINFGFQTVLGSSYSVTATNTLTTCVNQMEDTLSVSLAPPPVVYNVTGGGALCAGGTGYAIGLDGSDATASYQLYKGTTPIGSPVPGVPGAFDFGTFTDGGIYKVVATDQTYHCVSNMDDSAVISVNPLPIVYNVTGGGSYCTGGTGFPVTLTGSEAGISYSLYFNLVFTDSIPGTGSPLNFGTFNATGSYTVVADNAVTGCVSNMSGAAIINVNALPGIYNVVGGGSYCAGGGGRDISLDFSTSGVNYQLYRDGVITGAPVPGTDTAIDFGNFTVGGNYMVVGSDPITGCTSNMSGSATVSINALPALHSVSGGGSFCAGGTGIAVNLGGSEEGINYQLYNNGTTPIGSAVGGTGVAINFGLQDIAGTYSVIATDTTTQCTVSMSGGATIVINPAPGLFTVTGGGVFCDGTAGVDVGLSGSNSGIQYVLLNGGVTANTLMGSGTPLDFGLESVTGVYTVVGTNLSTGCNSTMSGDASVTPNPSPTAFSVIGGGGYCPGSATAPSIGISGSNAGVSYQLYRGGTPVGSLVGGTGGAVDFGPQSAAGSYTVIGTYDGTGCSKNMSGSAAIVVNSLPSAYSITGGGSYCAGGTGLHIYMSISSPGIQYQLLYGSAVIDTVAGTGAGLDMGLQAAAGTYTVVAFNPTTGCTNNMAGTATITVNSSPVTHNITLADGGSYCATGSGVEVTLDGSNSGINYQLYNGITPVGSVVNGTGSGLDFGIHTAGNYTIVATNASTGCTGNMMGSGLVSAIPLPTVYSVTGGGNYCSPGVGLHVGLSGSDSGTQYQLYRSTATFGAPVTSMGGVLDFGLFTTAGSYTVVATNGGATGCSNNMGGAAVIAVYPVILPVTSISSSAGSDTTCLGTITHFTASSINGGSAPSYEWLVNGDSVATGGSYSYLPVDGDMLTLRLHSNGICAIPDTASSTIRVTVTFPELPSLHVTVTPGDVICQGSPVTFTATSLFGGSHPTYTWIKNSSFVPVSGLSYSYIPDNNDIVMIRMISNYPCRLADTVFSITNTIEADSPVIPTVIITAIPGNVIIAGQSTTLTATATHVGSAATYQWLINGVVISGATNSSFTSTGFSNNDSVSCEVMGGCALTGFNSIRIHVSNVGVRQVTGAGDNVKLVPNPNTGAFTITGTLGANGDEEVSVEVTNMLGQVVYNSKFMAHDGTINDKIQLASSLTSGMYLLHLRSGEKDSVFHFVVQQ